MKSYINAIGTAVPEHKILQTDASQWMSDVLNLKGKERKIVETLYNATGIENRYSVLEDYLKPKGSFSFFANSIDLEPFPTVQQRMILYKNHALPLALKAIGNLNGYSSHSGITHLIVASCTGMYAPGLDIEIIEELGLDHSIERTSIQFMGCYAAFNAIKSADYICRADENAVVLVVCIELCSIHFQKTSSKDQLVSNALFGDGAAAVLISGKPNTGPNLALDSFKCMLAPDSKKEMAWHISDFGFEMTLSSYVPAVIKSGIKALAGQLVHAGMDEEMPVDFYAIHPGGRRILERIRQYVLSNCPFCSQKNYGSPDTLRQRQKYSELCIRSRPNHGIHAPGDSELLSW
jgi:alpha-pyrone synthase